MEPFQNLISVTCGFEKDNKNMQSKESIVYRIKSSLYTISGVILNRRGFKLIIGRLSYYNPRPNLRPRLHPNHFWRCIFAKMFFPDQLNKVVGGINLTSLIHNLRPNLQQRLHPNYFRRYAFAKMTFPERLDKIVCCRF